VQEKKVMAENQEDKPLPARSTVERHFYLMVLQCSECKRGGYELVSTEQTPDEREDIWYVRCRHCQQGRCLRFDRGKLAIDEATNISSDLPEVNPTQIPSELIDAGQWLALFYSILNAAASQTDRKESQRLGYEATLCLEEALKFYSPESDLPMEGAIWSEGSRQRLKEHPEQFVRQKLLQMREKLPNIGVMRQAIREDIKKVSGNGKKTGWWNRWFGGNGKKKED
jgi:hypothetical protein